MRILIIVTLIVYLLAVNVYGFLLVKHDRDLTEEGEACAVSKDGKYFVAGALGGALGIYISMYVFKYKLQNLFLMAIMPVLVTIAAFAVYGLFAADFFLPNAGTEEMINSQFAMSNSQLWS